MACRLVHLRGAVRGRQSVGWLQCMQQQQNSSPEASCSGAATVERLPIDWLRACQPVVKTSAAAPLTNTTVQVWGECSAHLHMSEKGSGNLQLV